MNVKTMKMEILKIIIVGEGSRKVSSFTVSPTVKLYVR